MNLWQLKASCMKKEKKDSAEKLEKIRKNLGIRAVGSKELLAAEVKLSNFYEETLKCLLGSEWMQMNQVRVELEALVNEFPPLRNQRPYAWCTFYQVIAHHANMDRSQFLNTLKLFHQINLRRQFWMEGIGSGCTFPSPFTAFPWTL